MSEKACYVFKSKYAPSEETETLEDEELLRSQDERRRLFDSLWNPLQDRINEKINAANDDVLSEVESFVFTAGKTEYGDKIPAGLLVTSASPSIHLFEQLQMRVTREPSYVYISITSSAAPNLKTLLKSIVTKSVQQHDKMILDDEQTGFSQSGSKLLGYDFQMLHAFCQSHHVKRVIITLLNSESLDSSILADFIQYLQIWIDRIPLMLLFDIGTSASALQDRLPATAIRCLRGKSFDAAKTDEVMETVFETACENAKLHLGPAVARFLFQRTKDYTQNVESFVQSLKYTYMCHIYGNPASAFLDEDSLASSSLQDLCKTIRHLSSFRSYAENLLSHKEGAKVRNLITSDVSLRDAVRQDIREAQDKMCWLIGAVQVFQALRNHTSVKGAPSFSKIYILALSGEFLTSPLLREALMAVKKISPDVLLTILPMIYDKLMAMPASNISISPDDFEDIHSDLKHLYPGDAFHQWKDPITNGNGVQRSRVTRNKQSAGFAESKQKHVAAYADIVTRFHNLLESYFKAAFVSMTDLFLHEIVFCDSRSLVQNALTPKPRASIERALSRPHDYLGCACCNAGREGSTSSQPPTAILYQLFVESGALVNVFDLWTAFCEILHQKYEDEQLIMALFFRSIAELKYMGMLKTSRTRVDHLGKVLWKGL